MKADFAKVYALMTGVVSEQESEGPEVEFVKNYYENKEVATWDQKFFDARERIEDLSENNIRDIAPFLAELAEAHENLLELFSRKAFQYGRIFSQMEKNEKVKNHSVESYVDRRMKIQKQVIDEATTHLRQRYGIGEDDQDIAALGTAYQELIAHNLALVDLVIGGRFRPSSGEETQVERVWNIVSGQYDLSYSGDDLPPEAEIVKNDWDESPECLQPWSRIGDLCEQISTRLHVEGNYEKDVDKLFENIIDLMEALGTKMFEYGQKFAK